MAEGGHIYLFQIVEIIRLVPYATNTPSGPRHDFKTLFIGVLKEILYFFIFFGKALIF